MTVQLQSCHEAVVLQQSFQEFTKDTNKIYMYFFFGSC